MDFTELLYVKDRGLGVITLNRPETMNALSAEMGAELMVALEDAQGDREVKAIVLTGNGRAFCSGANPRKLLASREEGRSQGFTRPRFLKLVKELDKPLIAAVNGACVGGGMELALHCDLRLASDKARFGAGFIRMGSVVAPGIAYYLPRIVGMARALELMLTARIIDAQEALSLGLVSQVVPQEDLIAAVWELALPIVRGPSVAIAHTRKLSYRFQEVSMEAALEEYKHAAAIIDQTEDAKEGPRAWVEKREPHFQGR